MKFIFPNQAVILEWGSPVFTFPRTPSKSALGQWRSVCWHAKSMTCRGGPGDAGLLGCNPWNATLYQHVIYNMHLIDTLTFGSRTLQIGTRLVYFRIYRHLPAHISRFTPSRNVDFSTPTQSNDALEMAFACNAHSSVFVHFPRQVPEIM